MVPTSPLQSRRHRLSRSFAVLVLLLTPMAACRQSPSTVKAVATPSSTHPRPAVISASDGERRFLRGGKTPLLIKVDPINTGSQRMVLGSSDIPPGDAIAVHRHLREDEIILITRGTARVQLGAQFYTATTGATVFIPQGTCIAVSNIGPDTLSNVFIFSAPGFEQVLREVSSPVGAPPKTLSPTDRAVAFHHGYAEAGPTDC